MVIDYCPVCGYGPGLGFDSPEDLRHSFEICRCCGCEYGYDDNVAHYERWVAQGLSLVLLQRSPSELVA